MELQRTVTDIKSSGTWSSTGRGAEDRMKCTAFRKQGHPKFKGDGQGWEEANISDTLNVFDNCENRTPILIVESK